MSWQNFLEVLCKRREYGLTSLETEVVMCLEESNCQTKNELLQIYIRYYSSIEEEAFTQRLKNIYKKFQIAGSGQKLPQLQKYLIEKYIKYKNKDVFFFEIGLTYIHPSFPKVLFGKGIYKVINLDNHENKRVDILQTFATNMSAGSSVFVMLNQQLIRR
jgi:hypothetical protein